MEEKTLRHVVLFKFKNTTPKLSIKEIENAFMALKNKIDVIDSIEWGTDISPEGISQGFTHCFIVTFSSTENRDTYLPHPDHKNFGHLLEPFLDKVLVVDFWAQF